MKNSHIKMNLSFSLNCNFLRHPIKISVAKEQFHFFVCVI